MKRLFCLLTILLLSGCASLRATPPHYQVIPWTQRQSQLTKLIHWQINAAIAIQTRQKSMMGQVIWQQQHQTFSALFSGPLGFGSVRVAGRPGQFTLWKSAKQHYSSVSAEQLMQQQLGWSIPIANLYYWVRGLPLPNVATHSRFDRYGHLTYLQQQGWQIRYADFRVYHKAELPSKIWLASANATIKLVIQRWQF